MDRVVYVVVCVGVWSNEVEVHVVEEERPEERPEEEVPAVTPTPARERVLEPLARAAMVAGVIGIPLLIATIVTREKKEKS